MIKVVHEDTRRARKKHWCDSCCKRIEPGQRYFRQTQSEDGLLLVYRSHDHCTRASEIVAAELDLSDLEDGMPRVWDMEQEDREHILSVDPQTYALIWGEPA